VACGGIRDDLTISDWVVADSSSARSIRLRTRQIAMEHRAAALPQFAWPRAESVVTRRQFLAAARMAGPALRRAARR